MLPGKKVVVNPGTLGCQSEDTSEWKNLIAVLQDPEHKFNEEEGGSSFGKNTKESRRALRRTINKKMVAYLRKLNVNIPGNFRLDSKVGKGIFKFDFKTKPEIQTEKEKRFADLTKGEVIERIKKLNKYADGKDSGENDEYAALMNEAIRREIPMEEIYPGTKEVLEQFKDETYGSAWDEAKEKNQRIEAFGREEEPEK